MTFPMDQKCAVSCFDSYAPTLEQAMDMPVIVLTSSTNWEQTAADFSNQNRVATITHLFLPDHPAFPTEMLNDLELHKRMIACVNVHPIELSEAMEEIKTNFYPLGTSQKFISSLSTEQIKSVLSPEPLAKR
jgi:hypothetical protein